jgi:hypothetical protein
MCRKHWYVYELDENGKGPAIAKASSLQAARDYVAIRKAKEGSK